MCTVVVSKISSKHANHLILPGVVTPHEEVFFNFFYLFISRKIRKFLRFSMIFQRFSNGFSTVFVAKPPKDDGGLRDFYHTGRILFYNS
jgi:hypothetical protein